MAIWDSLPENFLSARFLEHQNAVLLKLKSDDHYLPLKKLTFIQIDYISYLASGNFRT